MRSRPRRLRRRPTLPAVLAVAVAAGLAVAAPAGARTYFVSGQQLPGEGATATMVGGLLGTWTFNDDFVLNPAIQSPLFNGRHASASTAA